MQDLLENLNPAQLEAVTSTEGFIRVIAGAGSGKTRALSHRFAYLVNELGILPGNILCVTFTNKSAAEMRQRIHNLTGDNDTGYINTFHGFCVSILQEDSHAVQYPKSFLVLDNSDIDAMLKIIYEERGLTLREMTFSKARDMIEMRKTEKDPEYYLDMIQMSPEALLEKYRNAVKPEDIIFYGYLYQAKKCFGLDYNDLIKFSLYIFDQHPDIKLKWQQRLEYIMIDEFQDIDGLQYKLMCVLCGYHRNLFIVGDPDQTIYSWRGANVRYLKEFDTAFRDVKTIMMNQNYRSTPQILAAANQLISVNKNRIHKDLEAQLPAGTPVICCPAKNAEAEAEWIASEIGRLHESGTPYKDITVLYRAHYVTRSIEDALLKAEIPYTIYSGVQFFDRMEIKDALCYLRMIAYKDDLSFMRIANVPKRNLGQRRMQFLQQYADEHQCSLYQALNQTIDNDIFKGTQAAGFIKLIEAFASAYSDRPISEVLTDILDKSGYEKMLRTEGSQERLDNLAELKQSIYEYEISCGEETTMEHYLSHIALFTNTDLEDSRDRVKLMTVHAAKGLEFPHVFLCAMNEGIFPSRKTQTLEAMEEERRLAFVAITRAKQSLYISTAEGRNFDGSHRYPSRFILDIGEELMDFTVKPRDGLIEETRKYIEMSNNRLSFGAPQMAFNAGDRIRHKVFGPGTILEPDLTKASYLIQFDEMDTPRSISFRVKMEKFANGEL